MRAGVERVVYTSSVATLALRADGPPADESISLSEQDAVGAYKRSKIAAERLVHDMVAGEGAACRHRQPVDPDRTGRHASDPDRQDHLAAACGRIPAFIDTGLNLVHVDDVAQGHLAALRHGRIGERYILGGQNVLFSQMLCDIAGLVGRRAPRFRAAVVFGPADCLRSRSHSLGDRTRAPGDTGRRSVGEISDVLRFVKAESQLGVCARPYAEGLRDAIHWFCDTGLWRRSRRRSRRTKPETRTAQGRRGLMTGWFSRSTERGAGDSR